MSELTLTILGCGTLGKAILKGILTSKAAPQSPDVPAPKALPTRFVACVTHSSSAKSIREELGKLTPHLTVYENDNLAGCRAANVVILGCKPYMVSTILQPLELQQALSEKPLISICAGVTEQQIEDIFRLGTTDPRSNPPALPRIIRVMPNTAAGIGQSMSVISTSSDPPLHPDLYSLIHWIFTRIGCVTSLPPHLMDPATALCGSGPAFFSLLLESAIDGAVAMGIPRKEAQAMAAQTMKGTAEMVLAGQHPALLRDQVTTPGGWERLMGRGGRKSERRGWRGVCSGCYTGDKGSACWIEGL